MIVSIYLCYKLAIELKNFSKLLFQQAFCAFIDFINFIFFVKSDFISLPKVSKHSHIRVNLQGRICLFSGHTAIFASTNFANIGTSPWICLLQVLNDIFFVDQDQTIQTELFLTRGSLIVFMTLINNFAPGFTHMTMAYFDERNRGVFKERKL